MDNRKFIRTFFIAVSLVIWLLSRSALYYAYMTFYQVRRFPNILVVREALPVLLALGAFIYAFRNAKMNTFLDEVVAELRKVTWPSRQDVVRSTTVVLVCIVIASFILATFDMVWGQVIGYLLKA